MDYFVTLYEDGREGMGTEEQIFIYDLKTLSGVKRRVMKHPILKKGKYKIYSFPKGKQFDEESYKFEGYINKNKTNRYGR